MSEVVPMHESDDYYLVEYVSMAEPMQVVSMTLPTGISPPYMLECTQPNAEPVVYYRTAAVWDEARGVPICSRPHEEEEITSLSEEGHVEGEASAGELTPSVEGRLGLLAVEWRRNKAGRLG